MNPTHPPTDPPAWHSVVAPLLLLLAMGCGGDEATPEVRRDAGANAFAESADAEDATAPRRDRALREDVIARYVATTE